MADTVIEGRCPDGYESLPPRRLEHAQFTALMQGAECEIAGHTVLPWVLSRKAGEDVRYLVRVHPDTPHHWSDGAGVRMTDAHGFVSKSAPDSGVPQD